MLSNHLILCRPLLLFIWLMPGLGCGMWDLVPCPEIEPGPLALRAQSLSYCTAREVPESLFQITVSSETRRPHCMDPCSWFRGENQEAGFKKKKKKNLRKGWPCYKVWAVSPKPNYLPQPAWAPTHLGIYLKPLSPSYLLPFPWPHSDLSSGGPAIWSSDSCGPGERIKWVSDPESCCINLAGHFISDPRSLHLWNKATPSGSVSGWLNGIMCVHLAPLRSGR